MKQNDKPSTETKNNWHNNPSNWKFGIFYFNKEDKRIFPPKKIKQLGWTINFANRNSIFVIVILILLLLFLSSRNFF